MKTDPKLRFDFVWIIRCAIVIWLFGTTPLVSQEAQWIWHPKWSKNEIAQGATFYRKAFRVDEPEQAEILIAADDKYDLFLNNRKVGSGSGTKQLDKYNVSKLVKKGNNLIAVRAENVAGTTAAIVARVQVKDQKGWRNFSTDPTWKSTLSPLPIWKMQFYNDFNWPRAQSFGKLGSTRPWDRPADVVNNKTGSKRGGNARSGSGSGSGELVEKEPEFAVEEMFGDDEVGSIIAFEFNEFGKIIASLEKGGLVLLDPKATNPAARVKYLTRDITAIQGILPLNGDIYVTGLYGKKLGLYRLKDNEADHEIDEIEEVLLFKGFPGEHGAHGLALGFDGNIYISVGNHVSYDGEFAESSPYRNAYEGSIVKRYEDPAGHAEGIRQPGGTIVRTDLEGSKVEVFAGGIRNAYDLAFNADGDLFTYDSDMETDIGMSWYRPTHLLQVAAGGDYGWRSGWAKWSTYYPDSLPPLADTGRGSPTGVAFYQHVAYPLRYRGSLFMADWSGGRIYNVKLKRTGASYKVEKELFVEGSPLNVTDLSVGPDGALYFATGGRMTSGGIFRVKWKGTVPESYRVLKDNVSKVIRQPQPQSAFGRQKLAELRSELGSEWDKIVLGVALSPQNPVNYRVHAINLMLLYGPVPSDDMLIRLSRDKNDSIRAKAARAMSLGATEEVANRLVNMLEDESAFVRRAVCESLEEQNTVVDYDLLRPLLISEDRFEVHAARKLLERVPAEEYRERVLQTDNQLEFIRGGLALLAANGDSQTAYEFLARVSEWLDEFISDRNFLEILRLVQVAIEVGDVEAEKIPAFVERMADEFPSGNDLINRELVRIVAAMDASSALERGTALLMASKTATVNKVDIAMHLQLIDQGWSTEQKFKLIDYLEKQVRSDLDGNFSAFIRLAVREFGKRLTPEEAIAVIKRGKDWPNAAMSAFYKLPPSFDGELLKYVIDLDKSIVDDNEETYQYIKKGIVAVLAQSGGEAGQEYLRQIWQRDEKRRSVVALALSLHPTAENWPYLVASINETDDETADVLNALTTIPQKPSDARYYRMLIVKALDATVQEQLAALNLLEHWTGQPSTNKLDPQVGLVGWQQWFTQAYPDQPPAKPVKISANQKWTVDLVLEVLNEEKAAEGSPENGRRVFKSAQCANCHRYLNLGDSLGPDLTTLARRFTTREILESIIHPNDVISDRYRSEMIATVDGKQLTGIVSIGPDNSIIVLQMDGKKTQVAEGDIEARKRVKSSIMPANLLESLSQQEIIDLFTYLGLQDKDRVAGKPRFRTR